MLTPITLVPIGIIHSSRKNREDDHWDDVESIVELDAQVFSEESLQGLNNFSHLEIIFFMHQVADQTIETKARHPRDRLDLPKIGIFAQRAKHRPNKLGLSCCKLISIEKTNIIVQGLDALDQTPLLDIKPYVQEFGPRGDVYQPNWMTEIMKVYY
ncbi:MAG: tRNA (N6-threonylcarbamoyladenosine(37)-N6)-methyltransferase TrmO [Alphaproteobacteria bacterium]|nr:tRNA (N6-threonylcarbamoyladenosine(37)-N6)-methyltransferase TrmO [Alphaproteobacteria bacterium]